MAVREQALARLVELIGKDDVARLRSSAKRIDDVDNRHRRHLEQLAALAEQLVVAAIEGGNAGAAAPDFDALVLEHWRDTTAAGIEEATANVPEITRVQLAAKADKVPRSMRALRDLYDFYRTNPRAAKRQAALAAKIKSEYLRRVNELVRELSKDFAAGKTGDRDAIAAMVKKKLGAVWARAKTTLETESTRNYNQVRRAIYDRSPDVTHYLFVCIRDFATTQWCKDRDKLVYKKGTAMIDRETPPCHWNCRSEMLPLTMQNPQHARLIRNRRKWRDNNKCKPLPHGWVSARAA